MPNRILATRDLVFQSSADYLDRRFGLHCLRLSRLALFLYSAGLVGMFAILSPSDGTASLAVATLPIVGPLLAAKVVAAAWLARFERRAAGREGVVAIPALRNVGLVTGFMFAFTVSMAVLTASCLRAVGSLAAGHGGPGGVPRATCVLLAFACISLQPVAVLYAGCEWRRLHRGGRRRSPSSVPVPGMS